MRHTAQRLLRLIALLQARRHWSGADLAERMQVDRRSIRRDIDRLRGLGYPIKASSGVGGGYQLGTGAPVLPLVLEESEATVVALALRAAASSMAGIEDTAQAVLAKLAPLRPGRARHPVGDIHAATSTLSEAPGVGMDLLGQLAVACGSCAALEFVYRRHDGEVSQRQVEAQHLVNYGRRWYLLAWDRGRSDWRTYRVDRIDAVQAGAGQGLRRPLPATPDIVVQRAVTQSPFTLRAELRLAGAFDVLLAQLPPWCGVLQPDGPDHCLLEMGADSAAMLAGQILSIGMPPLSIRITPPALQAQLAAVAAQLSNLLRQPTSSRDG